MTCMYCGCEINGCGNDPADFGLHDPSTFENKRSCDRCNQIVTVTNRILGVCITRRDANALNMPKQHASGLDMFFRG